MNSEPWLRTQYQTVVKERDALQNQLKILERENEQLRNSVFHLSQIISEKTPKFGFHLDNRNYSIKNNGNEGMNRNLSESDVGEDKRLVTYECDFDANSGAIFCADYSNDGRYLATGGLDRNVRLWNGMHPYKLISTFTGHSQLVSALSWDSSPKAHLFSTSFDKTVSVILHDANFYFDMYIKLSCRI
jgi:WD40 repeat protein